MAAMVHWLLLVLVFGAHMPVWNRQWFGPYRPGRARPAVDDLVAAVAHAV